jgi:nucleoside-diphosphate-sugar epimerase
MIMKILVTGSDGYIGAMACPHLTRAGHEVVGLDTGLYRQGWLYEPYDPRPATLTMDIRDITARDLEGFDAVVHMAELSNDPLAQQAPDLTKEINHAGSIRLAKAARQAGVRRFVYMSSCSVYGIADGDSILTEDSPVNPQTAYAACKVAVERDLTEMMGPDFTPCFLRNATVFGASPRQRFDLVLNDLCGLAWTTGRITLLSNGTPWRPLVHVQDVCHAVQLALEAPAERVAGVAMNVGSDDQCYRVIDIARIVAAAFPGCKIEVGPPSPDNRSYRVSFARINGLLPQFRCQWNAERGALQMKHLFQRIGLEASEFGAPPYTRQKMVNRLRQQGQLDDRLRWANARIGEVAA